MEWVKLYTTFATDPKVIGLSDRAFRRYVEAVCYAGLHETDGRAPFKPDRITRELEDAGLVEGGVIHGWLKRQRSKAQVDAKRNAGRNAARIRWRNAEPNTEVEVEGELEVEQAKTELRSVPPNRPDEDQGYLAEQLGKDYGITLSMAALQKLNALYSRPIVSDALRYVRGFPPEIPIRNPYAYIEAICKDRVSA